MTRYPVEPPDRRGVLSDADSEFDTSRYHETPMTALRTGEFKYVKGSEKTELFELPDEETEVGDEYPAVRDELDARLEERLLNMTTQKAGDSEATYSAAMEQQLADLGYL